MCCTVAIDPINRCMCGERCRCIALKTCSSIGQPSRMICAVAFDGVLWVAKGNQTLIDGHVVERSGEIPAKFQFRPLNFNSFPRQVDNIITTARCGANGRSREVDLHRWLPERACVQLANETERRPPNPTDDPSLNLCTPFWVNLSIGRLDSWWSSIWAGVAITSRLGLVALVQPLSS